MLSQVQAKPVACICTSPLVTAVVWSMLLRLWRTELKLASAPLLSWLRLTVALTEPAFLVLQGRGE